jgi:integrase/recombinase XerC
MAVTVRVEARGDHYRLVGSWDDLDMANAFLAHLAARAFSARTIRAYA